MAVSQLVVPAQLQHAVKECRQYQKNAVNSGQHHLARQLEDMCAFMELAWSAAQADWNAAGRKKHLRAKAQVRMDKIEIPKYHKATNAPNNLSSLKYMPKVNMAPRYY